MPLNLNSSDKGSFARKDGRDDQHSVWLPGEVLEAFVRTLFIKASHLAERAVLR